MSSRHTQIKVVEHRPVQRIVLIGCAVVAVVGALVIGFSLGQNKIVTERVSAALLSEDLGRAETQIADLSAKVIDAELNVKVQRDAAQALREDLTAMHEKNADLEEELTFYKSLMAPSSLPQGLQIAELALEAGADPELVRFQLLLTQVAKRRSYISGTVRIDVIGTSDGDEAVLSLTELGDAPKYPLQFRFRYFQDFAGTLALPEGFEPDTVLVTATQNGTAPLQASFPWGQALAGGHG